MRAMATSTRGRNAQEERAAGTGVRDRAEEGRTRVTGGTAEVARGQEGNTGEHTWAHRVGVEGGRDGREGGTRGCGGGEGGGGDGQGGSGGGARRSADGGVERECGTRGEGEHTRETPCNGHGRTATGRWTRAKEREAQEVPTERQAVGLLRGTGEGR